VPLDLQEQALLAFPVDVVNLAHVRVFRQFTWLGEELSEAA
jgi:hypothetical protein